MKSNNTIKALEFYCSLELNDLRNSEISKDILVLAEHQNLHLNIEFGKLKESQEKDIYISFSVMNSENQIVEVYDDGYLSYSTRLVTVDNKNRISFRSWVDDDFIETLNWIKSNLQKVKK